MNDIQKLVIAQRELIGLLTADSTVIRDINHIKKELNLMKEIARLEKRIIEKEK